MEPSSAGSPPHRGRVAAARYEYSDLIGEGTYGCVYRASCRSSGQLVAIKELKWGNADEGVPASALREISLLLELEHPNVIRLKEIVNDSSNLALALVFELLDTDLYRLAKEYPKLMPNNPQLVQYYMWQILKGLEYCHARRVLHRDMKPQNVLVDISRNVVKVADFGLARAVGMPLRCLSPEVVTLWYRAPELLVSTGDYSAAVDLWSVGCMLYEMTFGRPLFPGMTEIDQISMVFNATDWPSAGDMWVGAAEDVRQRIRAVVRAANTRVARGAMPRIASVADASARMEPAGGDLLRTLLMLDPHRRTTARAALAHPYFANIVSVLRNPPCLV